MFRPTPTSPRRETRNDGRRRYRRANATRCCSPEERTSDHSSRASKPPRSAKRPTRSPRPHASSAARISSSSKRRRNEDDADEDAVAEDGSASSSDSPAASGKRTCARRLPRGMYGACGRNKASSRAGAIISPVPSDHTPATARRSEDLPHPLGPTTSAASPSRSSRVRSRHSSRRERGVRTETRSRRSVAPSRGTPRRIETRGVGPRRESKRDFLGAISFPARRRARPRARARARGIFDGVEHRQESFQALRLRGKPRELLEAPDDDVERPLHGSKRVPGLRDHPELDLAGEEPGRDDETG